MTTTDVLAIIGAITGVIGTITGCMALGWDFYKWRRSERVILKTSILTHTEQKERGIDLAPRKDEGPNVYFAAHPVFVVRVVNIGKVTTTITAFGVQDYKWSRWSIFSLFSSRRRRLPSIHHIDEGHSNRLPFVLEPGFEWLGAIPVDAEWFQNMVRDEECYASIRHSMGEKPVLVHIGGHMWWNA